MNKRIEYLIKTISGVGYDDDGQELTLSLVGNELEQFAELIVKECATVQHKRFCEHGDVSWDILMEHFGVEE